MGVFGKALFALAVGVAVHQGYQRLKPAYAPTVQYVDVRGVKHELGSQQKPTLVAFWIDNCTYSKRVMAILEEVHKEYSEQQLDVVGFYVNPIPNRTLQSLATSRGYKIQIVAAQQSQDLISKLHVGFRIRGAGTDIYLVDRKGQIHRIDASDREASKSEIKQRVKDLIRSKTTATAH